MIRKIMLSVFALLLATAALAWPPPPMPQCGPLPDCGSGCYEPMTERCQQWVADQLEEGFGVSCSATGACAAP